ncbi:hypothetical protein TI05_06740 [Achromatium sp. WMS3]|nr:hypothetical protein TI05_06740 [Achromatium sp. WMS3]
MKGNHLEILAAEPSTEMFLHALLPKLLGKAVSFNVYTHQCKDDLLKNLPSRLVGYANWLPDDWRVIVLANQGNSDYNAIKRRIEKIITAAELRSRKTATASTWQVASCIAREELESWYFGDWQAVRSVYTRVPEDIPRQPNYRNVDKISGPWKAFELILKRANYYKYGLNKIEIAKAIGAKIKPSRNKSQNFQSFCEIISEATGLKRKKD